MGMKRTSGFTIIEVVLFLSISGILTVGILAGAGSSINQQRYRDSVNSFVVLLQDQYSEVINTRNERLSSNESVSGCGSQSRGRAGCTIVGKLIYSRDSSEVVISNIIAKNPNNYLSTDSDSEAFRKINLAIDSDTVDTRTLEWDALLAEYERASSRPNFSVFIGQSPVSGAVRTFVATDYTPEVNSTFVDWNKILTSQALEEDLRLCVISRSAFSGPTRYVTLLSGSSNSSGISVENDENGACS